LEFFEILEFTQIVLDLGLEEPISGGTKMAVDEKNWLSPHRRIIIIIII
jgi:hypothetical protein